MAKPLRPFVRGGGYYPSKKWIPLVRNGGYTTQNGGETEPVWATASGAIASFTTPLAYPLKKLVAQINPVQAGTGDPSPDNIRPISGHTGLSVEVRGGNLLDKTGAVRGGFDASGNVLVNSGDSRCVTVFLEVKPNVTYYIDQTIPLTQGRAGFWYDANQTAISQISFNGAGASSGAVTSPANAKYCRLGYLATNEDVCTMTVGTSALSPYEPYNAGETITISWQSEAGTVYGGQDEVVGGELISTMASVDMGDLDWTYDSANARFMTTSLANVINKGASGWVDWLLCSAYKSTAGTSADKCVSYYAPTGFVVVKDTSYTDATAFKNAVTGVQLVYPLATPQSFTHTGQSVDTLVGQNNVWVNTGDVEVTYRIG